MTLGEKQRLFFELFIRWATWAQGRGYSFTFGEAKRSDEQAEINALGQVSRTNLANLIQGIFPALALKIRNNGSNNGVRNSCHELQLAVDLNAFRGGLYLAQTEDWKELGEYWESLNPLCRWGGRFNDGNHLSLEHNGVK